MSPRFGEKHRPQAERVRSNPSTFTHFFGNSKKQPRRSWGPRGRSIIVGNFRTIHRSLRGSKLLGLDDNIQNNRLQLRAIPVKQRGYDRPGPSGFLRYDHLDRGAIRVFKPLSAIVLERLFKRLAHRQTIRILPMHHHRRGGPT